MDASNKKLLLSEDGNIDSQVRSDLIKDALIGTVSAFDSLGKALRTKHPALPNRPKNLFQNFQELDTALIRTTRKSISQFLTASDSDFLYKLFQVRHIYEHNAGVIDHDFVTHLPTYTSQLGRKFELKKDDVHLFITLMRKLVQLH